MKSSRKNLGHPGLWVMGAIGREAGGPGLTEQGREFPGKAIEKEIMTEPFCQPQWSGGDRSQIAEGGGEHRRIVGRRGVKEWLTAADLVA